MPPIVEKVKPSLNFKSYPTNRDHPFKTGDLWLDGRRKDDGAEGLWRVHDGLYDLTDFMDKHPGGRMWLDLTKGTDATEAFESHHLTAAPESILKKHFIREAKTPRYSPFTFKEDGFYRTLKRNVRPLLKDLPKDAAKRSDRIIDALLIGLFGLGTAAVYFWSYFLGLVAGVFLALTTVAAHNYFHRKDNWRMYYFNLSLLHFREWRITHALSHHLFPNTIIDIEISFVEPFVEYLPKKKTFLLKYGSWLYVALVWLTLFQVSFVKRALQYFYLKDTKNLHWSDSVPFALPLVMYVLGGQSLPATLGMWTFVISCGSLWFSMVGFNAAHHAPDIFHEGDTPRSADEMDWGIFQLDTVADRYDINKSHFLILTNFGDHALHHLFPTMDHATLEHLYPIFRKTMEEFGVDMKIRSQLELVKDQFLQLAREEPNPNPPGAK